MFASMIKYSLKSTLIYGADINHRQHFQDKNIGWIRVVISYFCLTCYIMIVFDLIREHVHVKAHLIAYGLYTLNKLLISSQSSGAISLLFQSIPKWCNFITFPVNP